MSRFSKTALIAGAIALCASPAFAHPGHEFGHTALQGFFSPLGGIDHVIAMIAVGALALCRGGRAIWTVPLAFVLMMAVGAVPVSYTHLRAHETKANLVCRLLLENK